MSTTMLIITIITIKAVPARGLWPCFGEALQGLCGPVQMAAGSGDGADLGEQPAQVAVGHSKQIRRRKKETSGHRRGRRLRADARVFQRLVTVSRSVVVHRNSASSLALFLRADLLEQQGRKAPPVLLQQVALSAEEEPGPEEDRVGPLSAEFENPTQVATASCSVVRDAPVGPLGVSFLPSCSTPYPPEKYVEVALPAVRADPQCGAQEDLAVQASSVVPQRVVRPEGQPQLQQPRGASECAAPLWLPAVSHVPPPAVSSVDVAAVVAAPAVVDLTR